MGVSEEKTRSASSKWLESPDQSHNCDALGRNQQIAWFDISVQGFMA
jgi:hypothetical protein